MKTHIAVCLCACLVLLFAVACSPNNGTHIDTTTGVIAPAKSPILLVKDRFQSDTGDVRCIMQDTETGVEYILIVVGNGITLVPRIGRTTVSTKIEKE